MVPRPRLSELLAELVPARAALSRLVSELGRFLVRIGERERPLPALVVMDIRHYYSGLEGALVHVARTVDGRVPHDPDELVALLARDVPDVRPAVVDGDLGPWVLHLAHLRDAFRESHHVDLTIPEIERYVTQLIAHDDALHRRFDRLVGYIGAHEA
ncbi:MAG: hypothetical protein U1F43_05445 [Myxococcota bacterium]